ncbi:hypothetical protein CAPTEDRAFT_192498 [Capitella teleta]|uniref:G-protein coupled receptors family 1 profile domain-containing protein n=1 Tax=Capitella teleta TaxID=283909 RepID=R7USU5_CAPTE|nr:hypothetical protein CAPTEDRAFT_192498 [Capitella teleta]|eukprot:ELU09280.1 hypothetical protein CAPTEDRAFT_192498 [Capitella teleta]
MDLDAMHTLPDGFTTVAASVRDEVPGFCEKADADGSVALYTFHLVGILGMASLAIVGNSIVIFIMTTECKLSNALNCFIVNLACSDLLQGVLYAIYNISHLNVPVVSVHIEIIHVNALLFYNDAYLY